jgi:tRNA modification GTPase
MSYRLEDTIAAIATPAGEAGLAVVRVSGARAIEIADAVFRGSAPLAQAGANTLHHGWLGGEQRVDEVVAAVFRAPASYTREDVVEFSCHGGRMPARRALERLVAAGARPAEPGEFTMRAFVSGRLDLVQAEAVAELIHARSDAMHRAALARLSGELSRAFRAQLDEVTDLLAEVEARVDFAEDVGGVEVPESVRERTAAVRAALATYLRGAMWGRALREGVQVAIAGAPNAGKSSLFNRLVGEERAIVTELPGTTRDRVSATVEWEGAVFTFSDTAGLRDAGDVVEVLGVSRAREAIASSYLVIWVVDGADPALIEPPPELEKRRVVVALNKSDVALTPEAAAHAVRVAKHPERIARVSARTGRGTLELRELLLQVAGFEPGDVLASERQMLECAFACDALGRAVEHASAGEPGEIVAIELREAMNSLQSLLGVQVAPDLLERIFSKFCVGK